MAMQSSMITNILRQQGLLSAAFLRQVRAATSQAAPAASNGSTASNVSQPSTSSSDNAASIALRQSATSVTVLDTGVQIHTSQQSITRSGYQESVVPSSSTDAASAVAQEAASSSQGSLQKLRVRLPSGQHKGVKGPWIPPKSSDPLNKYMHVQLSGQAVRIVEKMTGCLTKEGKKTRAQQIVRDALSIMQEHIAKGTIEGIKP